jgi:hypothetical protein
MPRTMTTRRFRPAILALLASAALLPPGVAGHAQERLDRLPRDVFDVIPASERIIGERGAMQVYQGGCRIGPTAWARRRIVDIAVQEWAFFGFQTIDTTLVETRYLPEGLLPEALNPERPAPHGARVYTRLGAFDTSEDLAPSIAGYWSAAEEGAGAIRAQNRAWNGDGGDDVGWVQPWSAAFISWVMCEAGLGDMAQFERSVAHRVYIDQAIRARDGSAPDAAFIAHDAGEEIIAPGDLLCNARGSADYLSLADRRPDTGRFAPTHCDIVVKADPEAMRFLVIGGNVQESVSLTILPAVQEDSSEMRPVDEAQLDGARTIFAHLKLNADAVEANAFDNTPTIRSLGEAVSGSDAARLLHRD